jgi:hypothetical protein
MKKIMLLGLAVLLIMGMSPAVLAVNGSVSDNQDITVEISEYYAVEFLPHGIDKYGNDIVGLFGEGQAGFELLGAPGIYVSDGSSTKNRIKSLWSAAIAVAPEAVVDPDDYYMYAAGTSPNTVDVFTVDANTEVEVTLSSDFLGWLNAPTILRVSSSENDPSYIHGIGNWSDQLAEIRNLVSYVPNSDYDAMIDQHNALSLDPSFVLDFTDTDFENDKYLCYGPIEFHVNAAIWLPKVSMAAAGEYTTNIVVTVAPTI